MPLGIYILFGHKSIITIRFLKRDFSGNFFLGRVCVVSCVFFFISNLNVAIENYGAFKKSVALYHWILFSNCVSGLE